MKNILIPTKYFEDLFNRSCGYMRKLCHNNPKIDWSNNDTIYRASAAWKDYPIHYCLSGLKFKEYAGIQNNWDFYVLYGFSESFYELGFTLVYDIIPSESPRLRLYHCGTLIFKEGV